ncbi:SGNH/GDSL hydrolase family protein [Horticoccus luteus]|uniref:SGNH/GDSL hydrolase family protein n=1 Tax=Horticoccus luteus TaxID=2862869 RepID=A0A8F9TU55_9BACT|nr:SGNH/GDSL hydrolase family protein [Horticoccus luteus]QYM77627.1 SGNH/GDSL hydrolase family protein [Horticoccus luteus]
MLTTFFAAATAGMWLGRRAAFSAAIIALFVAPCRADGGHWIGTWATSPVAQSAEKDGPAQAGVTLRQIVHVSLGGDAVRLRFSNAFGETPLGFRTVHIALAGVDGAIVPGTDQTVRFAGRGDVVLPPGAAYISDPVKLSVHAQADVAITVQFDRVPAVLTMHGGARTRSFWDVGGEVTAEKLTAAKAIEHWYFIQGLDVYTDAPDAAAVMVLGDSITDGYGTKTDQNGRWPDELVRLFQKRPDIVPLGVLNLGIGGNRLLRDGLGSNALARFDRDVLTPPGTRWLLVFEGINDIGTRLDARRHGSDFAKADDIIAALQQIVTRARAHGLRVLGGTITPYEGADFYFSSDGEADREKVNAWIRTSGAFDAVVDFDAALRDPDHPSRLAPAYDSGDHLHPSAAGARRLAETVEPKLFISESRP